MCKTMPWIVASAGLVASATFAFAEGGGMGEYEYLNSCAACHGASGKGDGPVTDFLSGASPSDLTVLQKNNGGVFPLLAVYDTIGGTDVASVHGSRDMPIWGNRFRQRLDKSDVPDSFSTLETELYVHARILALVEYLAGIQVE